MTANTSDCGDYSKVIWCAILDKRFKCEVQRTEPYNGVLVVFDSMMNDNIMYEVPVPISFDGPFGPDIVDVAQWQQMVIDAIDNP